MDTLEKYANKFWCVDCIEFLKQLSDNCIDLIIIDPPYLVTKENWDKKEVVNERLVEELFRVLKDTGNLYCWCGIGEKSQSLIRWFPIFSNKFYFKDLVTWKKQRGIGMRKGWLYTREEIMWFVKDNKKFVWNQEKQYSNEKRVYTPNPENCKSEFKRLTNVWTDINESSLQGAMGQVQIKGHFTPKPIEVIERIIQCHTKENDIILDCFIGSGTTARAAQKLNRRWLGCDISEEYCKLARKLQDEIKK